MDDKISFGAFWNIKKGFVLFNLNSMPPIGSKLKVEWEDLTQTYEIWNGEPFKDEERGIGVYYRLADNNPQLEELMDIHYNIDSLYVYGKYGQIINLIGYHLENTDNKNILKTILIATKHLKDHPNFKEIRSKLVDKLNELRGSIMPKGTTKE